MLFASEVKEISIGTGKVALETVKCAMLLAMALGGALAHADLPTSGTYAVLTTGDCNADVLYANSLSEDAKAAVTNHADYGKGFFASSLTEYSKVNRWTLYTDGTPSSESPTAAVFPPNANYDYWIQNKQLATPNEQGSTKTYTFPGKSLTLSKGSSITHCSKGTSVVDLGTKVYVIGNAYYSFPSRCDSDPQTRGTLMLSSGVIFGASACVKDNLNAHYGLDWDVLGDSTTEIILYVGEDGQCSANWRWRGDASKFYGKLTLKTPPTGQVNKFSAYAPIAGTVLVQDAAQIVAASSYATAPISNLVLSCGSVATLASAASLEADLITVEDGGVIDAQAANFLPMVARASFVANGKIRVVIPSGGTTRPILTVPSSCSVAVTSFVFAYAVDGDVLPFVLGLWTDNGNGTKSLTVQDATPVDSVGTVYSVSSSATLTAADARVRVIVGENATLSLALDGDETQRMAVKGLSGSTINLGKTELDWSSLPLLWLDASAGDSVSNVVTVYEDSYCGYNQTGTYLRQNETFCDADGNPFILGWFDCRGQQTVKLWNARYDQTYGSGNHHNVMWGVHPRRVKNGLNGMDYIACDRPSKQARCIYADNTTNTVAASPSNMTRIYFTKYASAATVENDNSINPRYAFVVYGSQQGGGGAIFGNNANFLRGGSVGSHTKDDAIFASNPVGAKVWLDGTEVDPTKAGFNGSWQVVTIDYLTTTNAFKGLGYGRENNADNGGQAYAEIILVDQELTERQRQKIEMYLAEKWGLASQYNYPDWAASTATVYGEGTVILEKNATLGGAFAGTINLNGKSLVIDGTNLPPSAAAIDTTNLVGWYDPEAAGAIVEADSDASHPKSPKRRVNWLYDRRCGATATDGYYALTGNGTERSPWLDDSAHDFGPVRKWLDYSNVTNTYWSDKGFGTKSDGNTMRFRKASGGEWTGNVVTNTFRTIVMAQDSKYGGGQPFVDGNTVLPSAASQLYKVRVGKTASSPIYPSGTAALLANGVTRIDGVVVDGTTSGFRGRGEILAVQPTASYGNVSFEHLSNSENLYGANTRAAVQGEILMWNRVLDSQELARAEAYLAWKWLGIVQPGYSALTNATVTGAGKVTASSLSLLPKFDSGSTASVDITGTSQSFTYENGKITDSCDLGDRSLSLPAAVAVAVNFNTRAKAGEYTLIECGSGLNGTEFSLSVSPISDYGITLKKSSDGKTLKLVVARGMVLMFR